MKVFFIIIGVSVLLYPTLIIVSNAFVDRNKTYTSNSPFYRWLLDSATMIMLFFARVHIEKNGMEKLPEGRFLLISNHRSKFDPIVTWYAMRRQQLAFISKPENFKIPFFGGIIRRCCFLPINRENPRVAMKTVVSAIELLKSDEVSVGVYPEGTRNFGEGILEFHNGVFKIAERAHVPIVVVFLSGTEKIRTNFPLHRSDVQLNVLTVINPDEAECLRTHEIGALISEMYINEIQKETAKTKSAA